MVLPLIVAGLEAAGETAIAGGAEVAAGTGLGGGGAAGAFAEAAVQIHNEQLAARLSSTVNQLQSVTASQGTIASQLGTQLAGQIGGGVTPPPVIPPGSPPGGPGGAGQSPSGNLQELFKQAQGTFGGVNQSSGPSIPGLAAANNAILNSFFPGQPFIAKTEAAANAQQLAALGDVGTGAVWNDWVRRAANWAFGGQAQNGVKPAQ